MSNFPLSPTDHPSSSSTKRAHPDHSLRGHRVLVTGGAGYIGSHACVSLLEAGAVVVVVDNLSNGHRESIRRVEQITGASISFIEADVREMEKMVKVLSTHQINSVMHFAGLKSVGESNTHPLYYYDHNVGGMLSLLKAMVDVEVKTLIFSSSATVYGVPKTLPIDEGAPLQAINPYGQSKLMIEEILRDLARSDPSWKITLLRYFNPVGAHPSGLIGEDPQGPPNNLAPYIAQVALGLRPHLSVFGGDYQTPDGTGVRDYIHVMDLVEGHLAALRSSLKPALSLNTHLDTPCQTTACQTYNLGTGRGVSVLELLRAFEEVSGHQIPYQITDRREGDVATCYANADLAMRALGWSASRSVHEMVSDAWRWQSMNPNGYQRSL